MRDFVITADSNCDLPQEYVDANQIGIIPHYYDMRTGGLMCCILVFPRR